MFVEEIGDIVMAKNVKNDIPEVEVPAQEKEVKEVKVEAPKQPVKPKTKEVVVSDCIQLNIREVPNGNVICTVAAGTKLKAEDSNDPEWYKVSVNDLNGFAMKNFLK